MASTDHDIEILNNLIALTLDSAHGYEDASGDTKNPHFKTLFGKRAIERKQVTAELQTEVRRLLGGKPATTGTASGKAHRTFMNLKAAVTGSDQGVVNSVEAGEDHIKKEYEEALADRDLSAPVRDLVQRAFGSSRPGMTRCAI
ncbi:MAG: PA2169 family four-helix-bundle protein [Aliidongia sp.]